jgi:putative FmdB family regulatory protein
MPIYEFYCADCNTIFNFFSRRINTEKIPDCPKCGKVKLTRQASVFAVTGKAKESDDMDDFPFDEAKMEKAMRLLAGEADSINEDDPKQAAQLMRKLSDMTGLEMGPGMAEALDRMEKGEDPEQIEADMENLLEDEEPFLLPEKRKLALKTSRPAPKRDETLYDL